VREGYSGRASVRITNISMRGLYRKRGYATQCHHLRLSSKLHTYTISLGLDREVYRLGVTRGAGEGAYWHVVSCTLPESLLGKFSLAVKSHISTSCTHGGDMSVIMLSVINPRPKSDHPRKIP
jgi:hypothetical protein